MNANELDKKVDQLRELKRLREELDAELESVEDELEQVMEDQGVDELRGTKSKVTWKAATRTSVDNQDAQEGAARRGCKVQRHHHLQELPNQLTNQREREPAQARSPHRERSSICIS